MREKNTFKGILSWSIVGTVGSALIRLVVLMILARTISIADFGLYSITVIIISLVAIVADLGVAAAIIRLDEITDSKVFIGFLSGFFFATLWCSLLLIYQDSLGRVWGVESIDVVMPFICIVILARTLTAVPEALMQRKLKFKHLNLVELSSYFISFAIIAPVLAFMNYGIYALLFALLLQHILKMAALLWVDKLKLSFNLKISDLCSLYRFGIGLTIGKAANYLANQGDQLVINKMLGSEALGLYGRSYQVAVMPINMLGQALDKVLYPFMSLDKKNFEVLREHYYLGVSAAVLLSLPISVLFWYVGESIILLILGEQWVDAAKIFPIMTLVIVFRLINKISDSVVRAVGAVYIRAMIQIVFAISILVFALYGAEIGLMQVAINVAYVVSAYSMVMMLFVSYLISGSLGYLIKIFFSGIKLVVFPVLIMSTYGTYLENNDAIIQLMIGVFMWIICLLPGLYFYNKIGLNMECIKIIDRLSNVLFKKVDG